MIKTELVETKSISRPKGTYTEFSELQWVANKPLPPVDSEVEVKINGIGRSTVLKYFVEHGFIGFPRNVAQEPRVPRSRECFRVIFVWTYIAFLFA